MIFTIFFLTFGGDPKPPKTLEFSTFYFSFRQFKRKKKGCVGINFRAHLLVHFDFMKVVKFFF